jgi:putative ABC transport system permease protein
MNAVTRTVIAGALGRDRGRLALCVLAIALGVSLGFAVALVNASALREFEGAMRTLSGSADLEVRGPRQGFDESRYPLLAGDRDVAVASPVLEVDARLDGRDEALRIFGIDPFRAAAITPALVASARDPLDLLRPGNVFLSPAAAARLGLTEGDTLVVQSGLGAVRLAVAGLAEGASGERYAVMDIAAAQDVFERHGVVSRIDLRLRPGADAGAMGQRLGARLPAGVAVVAPRESASTATRMSRAYRVNLNVLALVALFTGALLVFSTQALSVVRRRPHFALLRTLGVTRDQLTRSLVVEGALLGIAGSAIGVAAGYALAHVAVRTVGVDLGAGYFRGTAPQVALDPAAALVFAAAGVLAAVLGSYGPAREAARAMPAAALKPGDEQQTFVHLDAAWPGALTIVAGAGMTLLPPVAGLPVFGYAAIACMLIGTLLLLPRIAALAVARLRPRDATMALALAQLRAAPGQAGVSLATLVASVSLMVSMAIMVASFRQSLDDWLLRVLPADVYLRAGSAGDTVFLTPSDQRRIAAIDGIARVTFLRSQSVLLDPQRPRVTLLARDLADGDAAAALPLVGDAHPRRGDDPPAAWVSEALADFASLAPGARLDLPIAGAMRTFVVAGIWRDYARQHGAVVIDRAAYASMSGDDTATEVAVWLTPGGSVAEFRQRLDETLPGAQRLAMATPGELRTLSLRIFDRTFAVTYGLLAIAVAIGLGGLSSAFGALVLARRREFGMLRHLGMRRRDVARMLASEGLVVSGIGLCVGLVLGFAMSLVLVHVVNRQSFHWGMEIHMPWVSLAALVAALLLAAVATTIMSARQAMSSDAVRAVREDW